MEQKLYQNNNIIVHRYCGKCLSLLDDYIVDVEGNKFCDGYCRKEFWDEKRHEERCHIEEWEDLMLR